MRNLTDAERTWQRVKKDDYVYWIRETEIRCFGCGKVDRLTAVVHEGPYDPNMVHEVKDEKTGDVKKIYPTFAPQDEKIKEWDIPDGWSQVTHLTADFFPNEIIIAIDHMSWSAEKAFDKWYNDTKTQYSEWVCPCEKCHVEVAKKNFRHLAKLEGLQITNGQSLCT